jgi:phosphoribosylanthranilate isomerase
LIVKICGIRSLEEALAALEAGADLLGFNFYPPSPRWLSPVECARIQAGLAGRGFAGRGVGIFVNTPPLEVFDILDQCELSLAQLSGDEPPEDLELLQGKAYKAIRPRTAAEARSLAEQYTAQPGANPATPALLVDAYHPGQYGGVGQVGDWDVAAMLAPDYPVLLAGGLRPENVARALADIHPWGVDVASGVETTPGRKDPAKVAAFVQAVRKFEQEKMEC